MKKNLYLSRFNRVSEKLLDVVRSRLHLSVPLPKGEPMMRRILLMVFLVLLAVILTFSFILPTKSTATSPGSARQPIQLISPDSSVVYPVTWAPMEPPKPGNPFIPNGS